MWPRWTAAPPWGVQRTTECPQCRPCCQCRAAAAQVRTTTPVALLRARAARGTRRPETADSASSSPGSATADSDIAVDSLQPGPRPPARLPSEMANLCVGKAVMVISNALFLVSRSRGCKRVST